MTTDQITTVITGALEAGGIGVFIWYMIRGLKSEIQALKKTIDVQQRTIDTMDKRIVETEKIGEIYRKLLSELPQDLDNYKAILTRTKDDTIAVLKKANEEKDQKLKKRAEEEIRKISMLEQVLVELPKLREEMENIRSILNINNSITRLQATASILVISNSIPTTFSRSSMAKELMQNKRDRKLLTQLLSKRADEKGSEPESKRDT